MEDAVASRSGGCIFAISSEIILQDTNIKRTEAQVGGFILASLESTLTINSTTIEDSGSTETGGVVNSFQTYVTITESSFTNFRQGGVVGDLLYGVTLEGVTIQDGYNALGGCFQCSRCSDVSIKNSTFAECSATTGGGLYFNTFSDSYISKTYILEDIIVQDNVAEQAGGLYINNIKLNITDSNFVNNTADGNDRQDELKKVYGKGGGAKFDCEDFVDCVVYLVDTNWTSNHAHKNGGAYSWEDVMPKIINNEFINNTAEYGADVASYPTGLATVDEDGNPVSIQYNNASRRLNDDALIATLTNVASG